MKNRLFALSLLAAAVTFSACGDPEEQTIPPTPPTPGGDDNQTEVVVSVPTVETQKVTDITDCSATASLYLTSDGGGTITALGIVWDEEPNPTADLPTTITFDGTEESYTGQMTDLSASTTYYYRAYATNEKGTAYGEEYSFTTNMAPTLSVNVNDITIDLVLVEGGTFQMGATDDLIAMATYNDDELPVHEVTLDSYYMAKFEVTQALWIEIMGTNPSAMIRQDDCPVDQISYLHCLQFIEALNERTGMTFALPTEAQWEYAARGGNKSQGFLYSGSNDATEVGWVEDNLAEGGFGQHPGGQKAPNELGIYDMTGNVNEWCADFYGPYSEEPQTNPTGAEPSGSYSLYVVRGGAFAVSAERWCRNTKRQSYPENYAQMDIGMRLVLNINAPTE